MKRPNRRIPIWLQRLIKIGPGVGDNWIRSIRLDKKADAYRAREAKRIDRENVARVVAELQANGKAEAREREEIRYADAILKAADARRGLQRLRQNNP